MFLHVSEKFSIVPQNLVTPSALSVTPSTHSQSNVTHNQVNHNKLKELKKQKLIISNNIKSLESNQTSVLKNNDNKNVY